MKKIILPLKSEKIIDLHSSPLKWLTLAIGLALCQSALAVVTLPFYEPFNYPDNERLGTVASSGVNWTVGNSPGAGTPTNRTVAALSYVGLPAPSGIGLHLFPPGSNKERGVDTASFPMTGNNETLYASFLLNVQSYGTGNSPIAYYDDNGSASGSFQGIAIQSDGKLSLYRNAANTAPGGTTTTALSSNTTYLIVFRYKSIVNSGNDELALWINPALGQLNETTPDLTMSSGGSDRAALRGFFIKQDATVTASMYFDELRLGANWTDVTPSGVCTPAGVDPGAPTNQTVFAGSPASFSITASGSLPTEQWQVSANGGATWNNESGGSGGNSLNYTTPTLAIGDNGKQYRCVVTVPCDGSSATSQVATVTVVDGSIISFRSATSSNWNNPATWEQSTNGVNWSPAAASPSSANSNITVIAGHTVTVTAPVTADDLTVQAGAVLASGGGLLTINDGSASVDCDVSGTLQVNNTAGSGVTGSGSVGIKFESSGQFIWDLNTAAAVPTATWADGSTCNITRGPAATHTPAGLSQDFYNFVWNWPAQANSATFSGGLTNVRGNFEVTCGSTVTLAGTAASTLNVLGNITNNSATGKILLQAGSSSGLTLNVNGNLVNAGTMDANSGGTVPVINFAGTNAQIFMPGNRGNPGHFDYGVNSGATTLLGASLGNFNAFTVDGTLNFGINQFTGTGTLTVNPSGTLVGNGTNALTTGLTSITVSGTLDINQSLPTFAGGEVLPIFSAATYNLGSMTIIPTPPPGAASWDTTTTPGSLIVLGGGGGPNIINITSAIRSGTDLILSGSGGLTNANGNFSVLTSDNPATPLASWTEQATLQTFDANGDFSYTNALGSDKLFYIIRAP